MVYNLVVVGASGFGRESLDVIEAIEKHEGSVRILGVVDDAPSNINLKRLRERSIPFLGSVDEWSNNSEKETRFVVGIGSPRIRESISKKLESLGFQTLSIIHPRAEVGSNVKVSEGAVICAGAVISTNVVLSRYTHVNPNVTIGHDSKINDFVSLNPGSIISGEVEIESGVLVGAGALILQQLKIGLNSTVGAGAVVTKDVPPNVVVKGVPGRWA